MSVNLPYAHTPEQQVVVDAALSIVLAEPPQATLIRARELRHALKDVPKEYRDEQIRSCVPNLLARQGGGDEFLLTLDGLLVANDPRPERILGTMLALIAERYEHSADGRRQHGFLWSDIRARGRYAESDYAIAWHTFRMSGLGSSGKPPLNAAVEIGRPGYDYEFRIVESDLEHMAENATVTAWAAFQRKRRGYIVATAPHTESAAMDRFHVKVTAGGNTSIMTDLDEQRLKREIVEPYLAAKRFFVDGHVAHPDDVTSIKIVRSPKTLADFSNERDDYNDRRGVNDQRPFDRRALPFGAGAAEDITHQLLSAALDSSRVSSPLRTEKSVVSATGGTVAEPAAVAEDEDRIFAAMAIEEARKSKSEDSRVHPMVGAVVVRDGVVLAKAHRGELGPGDHGEFTVLEKKLGDQLVRDATVYVTLEPCTTRKHPKVSCAMRLLERKVKRVVIGMVDPDPRISGRGISALRGGRVEIGFFPEDLAADVEELNREFIRSFKPAPGPGVIAPTPAKDRADLSAPLKALLAAAVPESQAHPRVIFLKELLASEYKIAKVSFHRERQEYWLDAPRFYLTLKREKDLRQEVFDWQADIEKLLLGLGLRVTDGDESARGGYLLLQNLVTADATWGKDYCDAVLCEYLEQLFADDQLVMSVVREVPTHRASASVHKSECLQYLQHALGGYLASLMMELGFTALEAQPIFSAAVAKMLDERCHVSSSKAMFPR